MKPDRKGLDYSPPTRTWANCEQERMPNGPVTLTGPQAKQFSYALLNAFPNPNRLDEVLWYYLNRRRPEITLADDLRTRVADILRDANAQGWIGSLLAAARQANPGNADLLSLGQQFGMATTIATVDNVAVTAQPSGAAFEKKIKEANPFLDVVTFRTELGLIEGRICKVEVKGDGSGTGFLVGTDAVITNYHVVQKVIDGKLQPAAVTLRFDYKRLANDSTLRGTEYKLAADWKIDVSKYSDVDLADPASGTQETDRLDYALVRVEGTPADDPVGGAANADPSATPRGFIAVPTAAHDFRARPALFIVQHPDGGPLQLALDTEAVIDVNANGARVRYRTNTEPGSSGSPCFDGEWKLVALHHLGDPKWGNPTYNQGIPFMAIRTLLETNKVADALGKQGV